MGVITRSIVNNVSFALQVFNDLNFDPIVNGLQFYINDSLYKPIRKNDGIYVFVGITGEKVTLKVEKSEYFDFVEEIDLSKMTPISEILSIRLRPSLKYSFNSNYSVVRLKVSGMDKDEGCIIKTHISDENYYHGRLIETISENEIKIASVYGNIRNGDVFHIAEDVNEEYIEVLKVIDNERVVLKNPLHFKYSNGLKLYKSVITQTDIEGNGIVYFSEMHHQEVNIRISIQTVSKFKEVDVLLIEGKAVNLGIINIERRE